MKMNFSVQKKPKVENVEKLQVKSPKDVYNLEIIQEIKDEKVILDWVASEHDEISTYKNNPYLYEFITYARK